MFDTRRRAVKLANYGFWCTANCPALQRVLRLSFTRLARLGSSGQEGRGCDYVTLQNAQQGKEYTVLYTTGPDVVSEVIVLLTTAR